MKVIVSCSPNLLLFSHGKVNLFGLDGWSTKNKFYEMSQCDYSTFFRLNN